MKKVFLLLCLMATTTFAMATDLWEEPHAVDWSNTLTIESAKFADAQVGQKIVIEFNDATGEVIELHSNGGMLPGTRYAHFLYPDQHSVEVFITPGMLTCLKDHGMEVCGKGFTATKLWYGDGKDNVDENTVWTGYFWMDEWSTLEIAKTSFEGINWSDYKAIRFYSEANRTDYVINVLTKWGDDGKLGDQTTMTMTNEYAELSLDGINMAEKLADVDRLMVQCNKESGNPFNFTAIALVKKENPTDVRQLSVRPASTVTEYYNFAGQHVAKTTRSVTTGDACSAGLKKGLIIVRSASGKNGKKILVK